MFLRALILWSSLAALVECVQNRAPDNCVYDQMHKAGGAIAACTYTPVIRASVTIGDTTPAFDIDGAHLESRGAIKYLKEANKPGLSSTDFLKCTTPQCPELTGSR